MTPESLPPPEGGSDGTADPSAPPGHEVTATSGEATPRRRRRWWLWGLASVLLVGAVLGFLFVPTPYVLIQPGAVRPADERLEIQGVETYEDDGEVLFTTVFVDRATLFGLMRGSFDDAIDVKTQDEVYGTRGRDETREINRQQMDVSKLVATMQALELLGYESRITAQGALVLELDEGSPASEVIRAGDVIVAVDGAEVELPADLREALAGRAPGDEVEVSIRRAVPPGPESASGEALESELIDVTTSLIEAEDAGQPGEDPSRAVLGVSVEAFEPEIESEVEVGIDSGTVTGPSAGLAWSLAVIDALTPGSLTGERDVAVTGEMLADGSIGVIGGITQKVSTVARNDVEVFIYPADTPEEEQVEMRRIAGDDVELVPVSNLAEAVDYLDPGILGG